jgi:ribosome recycling factor
MDPEVVILEAQELMEKSVAHTVHEFSTLHTGKASPGMVENIQVYVESYGASSAVREIAAVTTPDARTIQIQPWDRNTLKDIEKAILAANIGLNPSIQGHLIRVPVPELSGERRRDLAKVAHNMAEQGRVAIRHARHSALDPLKKAQKAGDISEDDLKRFEKEVQSMHDDHIAKINAALAKKEKELTTVV